MKFGCHGMILGYRRGKGSLTPNFRKIDHRKPTIDVGMRVDARLEDRLIAVGRGFQDVVILSL